MVEYRKYKAEGRDEEPFDMVLDEPTNTAQRQVHLRAYFKWAKPSTTDEAIQALWTGAVGRVCKQFHRVGIHTVPTKGLEFAVDMLLWKDFFSSDPKAQRPSWPWGDDLRLNIEEEGQSPVYHDWLKKNARVEEATSIGETWPADKSSLSAAKNALESLASENVPAEPDTLGAKDGQLNPENSAERNNTPLDVASAMANRAAGESQELHEVIDGLRAHVQVLQAELDEANRRLAARTSWETHVLAGRERRRAYLRGLRELMQQRLAIASRRAAQTQRPERSVRSKRKRGE